MSNLIDIHTHYVPNGWPDLTEDAGSQAPWLKVESETEAMIMMGTKEFRRIQSDAWDAEVRLRDMDADGVQTQVVSPTPAFFNYGRSGEQASRIARIFNDLALEIVEPAKDRLIPFCQVPLQDTDAACRELERCIANGHRGCRDRQSCRRSGPRQRGRGDVPAALRVAGRAGIRAPVGHGQLSAPRSLDGAVGSLRCRPKRTCRYSH